VCIGRRRHRRLRHRLAAAALPPPLCRRRHCAAAANTALQTPLPRCLPPPRFCRAYTTAAALPPPPPRFRALPISPERQATISRRAAACGKGVGYTFPPAEAVSLQD
jgi:hypothetical protein